MPVIVRIARSIAIPIQTSVSWLSGRASRWERGREAGPLHRLDHLLDSHPARVVLDHRLGRLKTHLNFLHSREPCQGSLDPGGSRNGSGHPSNPEGYLLQ